MSIPATMCQQVMTAPGEITFREITVPTPGPDQVLVRIRHLEEIEEHQ